METCTINILSKVKDKWWLQEPIVPEGIQWETARSGEPAKLTFTVVKDEIISFNEGDEVRFMYGETPVFFGYVFEKKRNKDHHIEVTCYDPTFYLKNKDSYVMTNVRADQIIARVAGDVKIPVKDLPNTGYVLPKFAKSEATLFDVIQDALDMTMMATGQLYCMYWDFDRLTLKKHQDMITDCLIDADTAEDFDYTTSINGNTFNSIVVKSDNGKTGDDKKNDVYVLNEPNSQDRWGILQTVVDKQQGKTLQETAQIVLSMYNRVSRTLNVNGALGDIRVRAGSSVFVNLYLGDHTCNQTLLVTRATHTFEHGHHFMELTLIDGRGFYG